MAALLRQAGATSERPAAAASAPAGAQDKHRPWEDALASDAAMTTAMADGPLQGYCWAGGLGWRHYDEQTGAWLRVDEVDAIERVRQFMLNARAYCLEKAADRVAAGQMGSADYWTGLADGWKKASTAPKITAVTKLARGALLADPAEFDTHPDLLNAPNGVIDLRTGVLGEHNPALRFTQVAGAAYNPAALAGNGKATGARHDDIDKALEAIPGDVQPYAQLRYGQAITGYRPPDDVIDVQYGSGENGKTTILAAIKNALGDYAEVLPTKLLFISPEAHTTELMTLRGLRLGIIEELPEDHQLSVAAIKIATAPRITARFVHKDNVSFANACSLVFSTNYRPQIRETDHGTWRRLEGSIPYPYTFRKPHESIRDEWDRKGDPTLRERVITDKGERAGAMLAWLVDGRGALVSGRAGRACPDDHGRAAAPGAGGRGRLAGVLRPAVQLHDRVPVLGRGVARDHRRADRELQRAHHRPRAQVVVGGVVHGTVGSALRSPRAPRHEDPPEAQSGARIVPAAGRCVERRQRALHSLAWRQIQESW